MDSTRLLPDIVTSIGRGKGRKEIKSRMEEEAEEIIGDGQSRQ